MHVGRVGVLVPQPLVAVPVRMRLAGRIIGAVFVLMVLVMSVTMRVRHWLVLMLVIMRLGQMERDTDTHERARRGKLKAERLAQYQDSGNGAHERWVEK